MGTAVKYESAETLTADTDADADDELASLKAALLQKEFAMKNLVSSHDKLKTTLKAEVAKLETENTRLLSALDEANSMREQSEGTARACKEEVQRLRSLLADQSQNKCKQTEDSVRSGTEARFREQLLLQFEEDRDKVQDQLKWKSEQFAHLEEAYAKLQSELKEVKREKETEQLEFLGKITALESVLDEKTRLAEDLRTRLEICNQGLAREESKRKLLQAELYESRGRYDSLVTDFEAAKLAVESVTAKRDEDIASLRCTLADKSLQIKEIEFQKAQIDQENKELMASLKEYREIEIGGVEKSKKYRALEKAHKGCTEKIKKREAEIENLKSDLDDKIARLNEKEELVAKLQNELPKIRVGDVVEMDNLKGDEVNNFLEEREMLLSQLRDKNDLVEQLKECIDREEGLVRENDRLVTEVRKREEVIKQLTEERAQLLETEYAKLCVEDEERKQFMQELDMCKDRLDTLSKEREVLLCELGEKNDLVEQVKECMNREKGLVTENDRLICEVREREGVIKQLTAEKARFLEKEARLCCEDEEKKQIMQELQICKDRLDTLSKEREKLLCELGEKNELVEQVKECMDREKDFVRENDRLICEVREREGVIKQLNAEKAQLLAKEERLRCEAEENKQIMKELQFCKDRLDILVKEKEMLLCEGRQREGIEQQLRECRDREEALLREKEKFISEIRDGQGLIEELEGNNALYREHISRLELEVCSLEEEKREFVEIGDDMANKLLEIKFKLLDTLEKKCTKVAKEKGSQVSGLVVNLDLLVEELESSISEKENLQLELQEMATSYFLQKHEIEFRKGLFCDLEKEVENLKNNLRVKEERFEAQLERERLESEVRTVRFSSDIKRLTREKETLVLEMLDLNCEIGAFFCADGENKVNMWNILRHLENEGEYVHEKKSKTFVPLVGTRSPLKENNYC